MQPYEIIGSPFEVFIAPVGESFPAVDTSPPGGNWRKMGTGGVRNQSDDGVTVEHNQTVNEVRGAGVTGAQKAFRTEEEMIITFTLWDLTLEEYAEMLNSVTVTETSAGAGQIGKKEITLYQDTSVAANALLIRGVSPYDEDFEMDYQIPRVYHGGSGGPQLTKGNPAGLAFEYHALIDLNASSDAERFGKLVAKTANATS